MANDRRPYNLNNCYNSLLSKNDVKNRHKKMPRPFGRGISLNLCYYFLERVRGFGFAAPVMYHTVSFTSASGTSESSRSTP